MAPRFRGESKNIEYKQEIPERHEKFLKDVVAFSNSSGGRIIIGVVDKTNEVIGIGTQNPFKLSDSVSNMIFDACEPMIEADVYPGTLYDGIDVEQAMSGTSRCRNYAIANAFQYMRIIDKWGTGIPRIIEECKEFGLPEPEFKESGDGVKAVIYRKKNDKKQAIKTSDKKQAIKTRKHIDYILKYLKENNEVTAAELAEKLGLSMDRTRVILKNMEEIETVGSNKNRKYKLK